MSLEIVINFWEGGNMECGANLDQEVLIEFLPLWDMGRCRNLVISCLGGVLWSPNASSFLCISVNLNCKYVLF